MYSQSNAQTEDFGLWTGFELEKKINKRFDVAMEVGNRLKDNLNQRDETFAGIGLSWDKKNWTLAGSYRLTNEKTDQNYQLAHRLVGQGQYEFEVDRFSISYRARMQLQYKAVNSSANGHLPESYFRNRLKADYNIKGIPLKPEISCEYFYRINQYAVKQFEKRRFILGLGYKINKDNQVGLSYILHETINTAKPAKRSIISIDYKLEI